MIDVSELIEPRGENFFHTQKYNLINSFKRGNKHNSVEVSEKCVSRSFVKPS